MMVYFYGEIYTRMVSCGIGLYAYPLSSGPVPDGNTKARKLENTKKLHPNFSCFPPFVPSCSAFADLLWGFMS